MASRLDHKRVPLPREFSDLLTKKGLAFVATIGPDGEPQVTPMWYGLHDKTLVLSHTKSRQKYRNLRRDARVAVSIVDPDDPYRYLEIRGTVEIDDDPHKKLIDSLAKKYMGIDQYPYDSPQDERVVLRVRPAKVNTQG